MLQKIVLSHNSSLNYTKAFNLQTNNQFTVYDSSKAKTQFTQSFNNCLKVISEDWIMICNNDVDLNLEDIKEIENMIQCKEVGIYSPRVNSPHYQMTIAGDTDWIEFVLPIIHKEVIEKIGYLDDLMPRGWGIDLDYCYRAKKEGFNIEILPTRQIKHYEHKSILSEQDYMQKASEEMNSVLTEKYGEGWQKLLKFNM
jgi:GT2 family glycosyltransferase